jgi:hypothetical protein
VSAADPRALVALLAKDDLLRVVGALALEDQPAGALTRLTGLPASRVRRALDALAAAHLVERRDERFALRRERFADALRRATARRDSSAPREIRPFFTGDRLRAIPAQRKKRVAVLRYLAERFERGREYREDEVNRTLGAVHEDYAALRRYLVDEGLFARARGIYRRAD